MARLVEMLDQSSRARMLEALNPNLTPELGDAVLDRGATPRANKATQTVQYPASASVYAEKVATHSPNDRLNDQPNAFAELGLSPRLVQATIDLGFTQPTVVQMRTVPLAMKTPGEGYTDLMVSSQTGSGKTAAFLLPVLHTLQAMEAAQAAAEAAAWQARCDEAQAQGLPMPKRPKRRNPTDPRNFRPARPGALVLCPTRELAQQVAHDAVDLVRHIRGCRIATVVGGMPYQKQIQLLQNASLVVATPGRLLDLQRSGQIQLEAVQILVVDEADRMLDLGFADDLAEVHQLTAKRQQTMMFSATFAPRIMQLGARVMREPQRVEVHAAQERHANIRQALYWADTPQHQRALLDHWLRDTSIEQAIVFASTQLECDALAQDLADSGFAAAALHGALSQGLRNRRLMMLRKGQIQILVATDVAARGIDVPSISHVFNYGLPLKPEDYTHRIGRTGRAGRDGLAVTIAQVRSRRKLMEIEAYQRQQIPVKTIAGLEPRTVFDDARSKGGFGGKGRGGAGGGFNDRRQGGFKEGRESGFGQIRGFGERQRSGERKPGQRFAQPRSDEGRFERCVERFNPASEAAVTSASKHESRAKAKGKFKRPGETASVGKSSAHPKPRHRTSNGELARSQGEWRKPAQKR